MTAPLNPLQLEAVSYPAHAAVIAGPGTGKTKTLLGKAGHLMTNDGVDGARIRVVNFTNAGVRDIRRKLLDPGANIALSADRVTTFHSLALRSLRHSDARRLPRPLVVLDDWEERVFLDTIVKDQLRFDNIRKAQQARRDYNARWCQAFEDDHSWFADGNRSAFQAVYRRAQEALGFLTRGELTFLWWRFLVSSGGALPEALGLDCSHLLVDEYQDLNKCEHEILALLAGSGITIFAVGDPNQSIYETLRHAHPDYCAEFPNRLSPARLFVLKRSYRCPRSILRGGTQLLGGAPGIPDPALSETEGTLRVLRFESGTAEASALALIARKALELAPQRTVLIAAPNKAIGHQLAAELKRLDCPVDDRTGREPDEGDACRYAGALQRLLKDDDDSVAAATAIILNCAKTSRARRVVELLDAAWESSQRMAGLLRSGDALVPALEDARAQVLSDLQVLRDSENFLSDLAKVTGCTNPVGFGQHEIDEELEEPVTDELKPGRVSVMTVNGAKGLEADWCILPAVEPGSYEREHVGRQRDERRRLLYVGMTRSTNTTLMSYATSRYGPQRYSDPTGTSSAKGRSAFIDETGVRVESGSEFLKAFLGS